MIGQEILARMLTVGWFIIAVFGPLLVILGLGAWGIRLLVKYKKEDVMKEAEKLFKESLEKLGEQGGMR